MRPILRRCRAPVDFQSLSMVFGVHLEDISPQHRHTALPGRYFSKAPASCKRQVTWVISHSI
ncbi:hypothetical protein AURDEDRAFT_113056 [Auricularia subglabra TFB-10046 SS5]|nr:hypothetical protein AURDEDRAFT_113056 [Auricularia subglabra TFB-10046 SS5]